MTATIPNTIVRTGAPSYGRCPRSLLRDQTISARAKVLYVLLDDYADAEGKAFPGRKTLSESLGCSTDSVDRAVAELADAGWLSKEVRRKEDKTYRSTLYTLIWDLERVAAPVRVPSRTSADTLAAPVPTEEEPQEPEPLKEEPLPTADAARGSTAVQRVAEAIFDQFWAAYPRKAGKGDARKAFVKAVRRRGKLGSPADAALAIIVNVKAMANDPNLPPKDLIPYPATWLNRDGWEDEPYPPRSGNAPIRNEGAAYDGPARQMTVDEWDQTGRNETNG